MLCPFGTAGDRTVYALCWPPLGEASGDGLPRHREARSAAAIPTQTAVKLDRAAALAVTK